MSKSSPQTPTQYSPQEIAQAQGQSNISTAAAQSALNNYNRYNPIFNTLFSQTGSFSTPYGSVPEWSQTTNLSPLGKSFLGNVQDSLSGPGAAYLKEGPQQLDQNAANAIYQEQKGFLDPQWNQQEQQLQDQLSRQGISVGNQAYNNATTNFDNNRTQAYQSAQDQATAGGSAAAQSLYNMALEGQQQPVNLYNALLSGAQTGGTPQTQVSPNDVTGAYGLSSQEAWQNYQAQLAQQNAMWGGLASLAGSGLMLAGM